MTEPFSRYNLDDNTQKKMRAKLGLGANKHGAIVIQKNEQSSTLIISEGTEDALAIKQVNQTDNIKCNIGAGQLKNMHPESHIKTIIIAADNDGKSQSSKESVARAATHYLEKGFVVKLAVPNAQDISRKTDMNDLLVQKGEKAILEALNSAVTIPSKAALGDKTEPLAVSYQRLKTAELIAKSPEMNQQSLAKNENYLSEKLTHNIQKEAVQMER